MSEDVKALLLELLGQVSLSASDPELLRKAQLIEKTRKELEGTKAK